METLLKDCSFLAFISWSPPIYQRTLPLLSSWSCPKITLPQA
jgi:hypothetical protein